MRCTPFEGETMQDDRLGKEAYKAYEETLAL